MDHNQIYHRPESSKIGRSFPHENRGLLGAKDYWESHSEDCHTVLRCAGQEPAREILAGLPASREMYFFAPALLPLRLTTTASAQQQRKRPRRTATAKPQVSLSHHVVQAHRTPSVARQVDLLPFLLDSHVANWVDPPPKIADVATTHVATPPKKRAVRKPHGYWNDLGHVEKELNLVNASLGRRGRRQMPRLSEMRALGRGDLIAALAKHGGVKHVAAMLRWSRRGKSLRKLPSSLESQPKLPYSGVRPKLVRQPRDYWADLSTLQREVKEFVLQYGVPGVMPTQAVLREKKRADLLNAIARHGGMYAVATSMSYSCRRAYKKRKFWKEFESFKKKLLEYAAVHCPGRMPTAAELGANGASGLANAVAMHGGYPEVARRCGLEVRNTASQGAPQTWDQHRLGVELRAFTAQFYPDLALSNRLPTERQLRKEGRNDLSYAVKKFGGFAKVRDSLGFAEKRAGPFNKKKEL